MNEYDGLVVLGKNIGISWTRNRIRKTKHFLSDRAQFSVIAGGVLFNSSNFSHIIFSGGKTAGIDFPSEAKAMSDFLILNFPDFPKEKIILEDISKDTVQNAQEVKKIADKLNLKHLMVMTTPEHFARSKMLFKKEGMDVTMISSSEVLKKQAPDLYKKYKYKTNPLEILAEKSVYFIQLIPGVNTLVHEHIKKSRSKA